MELVILSLLLSPFVKKKRNLNLHYGVDLEMNGWNIKTNLISQ